MKKPKTFRQKLVTYVILFTFSIELFSNLTCIATTDGSPYSEIKLPLAGAATVSFEHSKFEDIAVTLVDNSTYLEASVHPYIELSESDKNLIAELLWYEGRGECDDCKRDIVSVIINRVTFSNSSVTDVIYADKQFEPAELLGTKKINDEDMINMRQIVDDVCMNGSTLPEYITYFRSDKYHSFANQEPYKHHCTTYYSYDTTKYEKYRQKQER